MTAPVELSLGSGLALRTVRDDRDIVRYAEFHRTVINEAESAAVEHLLRKHPEMAHSDFFLVEDATRERIVSTTCLIPWRCQIEGVDLDVAMLEMVATHPEYRRRGLIRRQIEHFRQTVRERRFDLTIIQGIPYYYRQFGYAYACDHTRRDAIEAACAISAIGDAREPVVLRQASRADLPTLSDFYRSAMARVQVRTVRTLAYWRYLLEELHYPFQLVARAADGPAVGYALVHPGREGTAYIAESWVPDQATALTVLRRLAQRRVKALHIAWPEHGPLVQAARGLGSRPLPTGQWLFRITDVAGLLHKLGPVLEQRLAESDFSDLTADLCINLYHHGYVLRFRAGRLRGVEQAGFVDASMGAEGGDLNIPPDAFVRLALGYRGLDALRDAWPDIVVNSAARYLLDAMFPPMASYFCMPYHVFEAAAESGTE